MNLEGEYIEYLEKKERIEEANKLMTNYKIDSYLEEYFEKNKYKEFYVKYRIYGLLSMEYELKNGNFARCNFIPIDNDYNKIGCYRYKIPSHIVYQSSFDENSQFQKYTVKKLKNVCTYIYSKLNDSMDETMLETYKNYKFIPIKFELDYLKATYFKYGVRGGNRIKAYYINYLDFMYETGLFEYELSHIDEIHNNIEEKIKAENEKKKDNNIKESIAKEVYKYLFEKYNINFEDYDIDNMDESYWDGFGHSHDYHEQYDGNDEYYEELTKEHPNKHKVYRWSVATEQDVIISNFTITPAIAMFEYFDIPYLCTSIDLEESIQKIDELLNTPVECVMTLEEFIKNGFKI